MQNYIAKAKHHPIHKVLATKRWSAIRQEAKVENFNMLHEYREKIREDLLLPISKCSVNRHKSAVNFKAVLLLS